MWPFGFNEKFNNSFFWLKIFFLGVLGGEIEQDFDFWG